MTSAADVDLQIRRYLDRYEGSMPTDPGAGQEGLKAQSNLETQVGLRPAALRQEGMQIEQCKSAEETATAAAAESMMLHIT
jgi:hypothetical protein